MSWLIALLAKRAGETAAPYIAWAIVVAVVVVAGAVYTGWVHHLGYAAAEAKLQPQLDAALADAKAKEALRKAAVADSDRLATALNEASDSIDKLRAESDKKIAASQKAAAASDARAARLAADNKALQARIDAAPQPVTMLCEQAPEALSILRSLAEERSP